MALVAIGSAAAPHGPPPRSPPVDWRRICNALFYLVRAADQAGERGYEAAKKTPGIKRHILVDTLGLRLVVCIPPADVCGTGGRSPLAGRDAGGVSGAALWRGADQGYGGAELAAWVAAHRRTGTLRLDVVPRDQSQRGFATWPKRWLVERTFGWSMKPRRLVRHYEVKPAHAEAWLHLSMIGLRLHRLA